MPGLLGGIKNSISDNTGVTEKAIIEVIDLTDRKVAEQKAIRVIGKAGATGADARSRAGSSLMNMGMLADELKGGLKGGLGITELTDEYIEKVANKGRRYFTVQFNPTTLRLSGHAGGFVQKTNFGDENPKDKKKKGEGGKGGPDDGHEEKRSASYSRGITNIILSASLLFDCCDNQAAFLDDKIALNPVSMGKNVAKGVMSAMGKKKTSIQTEVEGFIAALRNHNTRLITFHWGEFNYSGILRSVGANYTMFSPGGEPLRATVDFSMTCADDEQWPNSLAIWQERYIEYFKVSDSFVKTSQKAGSLLNF